MIINEIQSPCGRINVAKRMDNSEMKEEGCMKGTVELDVEGNGKKCVQHIYILSHLNPFSAAK